MAAFDLGDLNAFVTVARHRNFRRAAAELAMSVSSLSQNVRELEERMGFRLLNRTTRSVALTEAGERLLTRLVPALREVFEAVDEVRSQHDTPAGRLRINAPTPAVQIVLAPMVAPFLKRFPNIELEIVDEPTFIDIVDGGFDAGVRFEEHLAQDMVAVPLGGPLRFVVAAAPDFLATRPRPQRPEDLLTQPCLRVQLRAGMPFPWEFEREGREIRISPPGPLMSTHLGLLLQAAIDGLGFLGTFEHYADAAIASGQLVTVLDDWCPPFPGPSLYYPSRRQPPPSLKAFIEFATEWRKSR